MTERQRGGSGTGLLSVVAVAVVCALVVSTAAVTLRPRYLDNLAAERATRLGSIVDALSATIEGVTPERLEAKLVELADGRYVEASDPATFDARSARDDPAQSLPIPPAADVAGIKRRAKRAVVFVLRGDDGVAAVILPVWGSGYQSALRGYLALGADASTVLALKFYEQGDTPGLGARIQEPEWEGQWPGKEAFDAVGTPRLGVGRPGAADPRHEVDGISGATRTSAGVDGLLRFWLGELGFGPYLRRVRAGEA